MRVLPSAPPLTFHMHVWMCLWCAGSLDFPSVHIFSGSGCRFLSYFSPRKHGLATQFIPFTNWVTRVPVSPVSIAVRSIFQSSSAEDRLLGQGYADKLTNQLGWNSSFTLPVFCDSWKFPHLSLWPSLSSVSHVHHVSSSVFLACNCISLCLSLHTEERHSHELLVNLRRLGGC